MNLILFLIGIGFAQHPEAYKDLLNENYLSQKYFTATYDEARSKFRSAVTTVPENIIKQGSIAVANSANEDLTIDYKYLFKPNNKSLLILTSGIHGGEGYTGSAIQIMFLEKILKPDLLNRFNVLVIHGLNPWGFKHFRRTTENNVDLNRNFDINEDLFKFQNEGYQEIKSIVQSEHEISAGIYTKAKLFLKVIYKLITLGRKELSQSFLEGQFTEKKGLYYGGNSFEPQTVELKNLIESTGKDYSQIVHIDLHTGFGERGKLHLFGSAKLNDIHKEFQNKIFEDMYIDNGEDDNFYETKGDLCAYIRKVFPDKKVAAMTFEFGTMNSQTTFGGFNSMYNMITENQGFYWGYVSEKDKSVIKNNFVNMFLPQQIQWRDQVMEQAETFLSAVIVHLGKE